MLSHLTAAILSWGKCQPKNEVLLWATAFGEHAKGKRTTIHHGSLLHNVVYLTYCFVAVSTFPLRQSWVIGKSNQCGEKWICCRVFFHRCLLRRCSRMTAGNNGMKINSPTARSSNAASCFKAEPCYFRMASDYPAISRRAIIASIFSLWLGL